MEYVIGVFKVDNVATKFFISEVNPKETHRILLVSQRIDIPGVYSHNLVRWKINRSLQLSQWPTADPVSVHFPDRVETFG